jgi:hypothetical protein
MLKVSIDDKINHSRQEMQETHNPIFNQSLLIEIQALDGFKENTGFNSG